MQLSRRKFLSTLALAASAYSLQGCLRNNSKRPAKPNIVLLLADDTGYGEWGCYGQKDIKTPVADRMAAEGMRFTQFYAGNTVCAPSRCCLMTGKDPGHATVRGNYGIGEENTWHRVHLKPQEETVAEMLKNAGYVTGMIGKWHLEDQNDKSTWAHRRGFDVALQRDRQNRRDRLDDVWINGEKRSPADLSDKEYICFDEFATDQACRFVEDNQDQPFYLFMSYKIPHVPEIELKNYSVYADRDWPDVERRHATRLTFLDEMVGVLIEKIASLGLDKNTVYLYTSDNGPHSEDGHDHEFFNSNGKLRGYKRDLYEGGIRAPMVVRWKDVIEPGQVTDHPSAFWDMMPTLADIAGISTPAQTNGISFLPLLLGWNNQLKHEFLYWEYQWYHSKPEALMETGGFRQAVRMGRWKGVRYSIRAPLELYDLETDVSEQHDISGENPTIAARIEHIMTDYRAQTPDYPYGGTLVNRGRVQNLSMDRFSGTGKDPAQKVV